ncbi:MFS transporter [Streptomyces sulphureus]|uniref:MFS transporter n=1 Tax=Streptomyces sulphureus TaxID=47758 RepID=UPI001FE07E62|nr:MFS transporter [Streptomyces sulphureus]
MTHPARHRQPGARRTHRAWWVAAVGCLTLITAGTFATLPGLLTTPLHVELGFPRGAIGAASAVNMALAGLAGPFAAALMERFGIQKVAAAALLTLAAGGALTATLTAPWQFVLYWGLLIGTGSGALALAFAALLTERWFVARRGLVSGVLSAASVFGQMAFLPVLATLTETHGWRPTSVTLALAAFAATPPALLLLRSHPADLGERPYGARAFVPRPPPAPGAARNAVRTLATAVRTRGFRLPAAAFAVCGASTNGVLWTHFTPAAHDHGMPATSASALLAAVGVCNVVGSAASGWLTDRIDPRRLLAVCFALRGLLLLALPFLLGPAVHPPLAAFAVLFGLLDMATVPPVLALCRAHFGVHAPVVFAWATAVHQIGAAVTAALGGLARDVLGSYDPLWTAVGALCAVLALYALLDGGTQAGTAPDSAGEQRAGAGCAP